MPSGEYLALPVSGLKPKMAALELAVAHHSLASCRLRGSEEGDLGKIFSPCDV